MKRFLFAIICILITSAATAQALEDAVDIPSFTKIQQAIEANDPKILRDITQHGLQKDHALSLYILATLDTNALEQIEDNRVHDATLMYLAHVVYQRASLTPESDYCTLLRGNYKAYTAKDTAQEASNQKNVCNRIVAAIQEHAHNDNACKTHIEKTYDASDERSIQSYIAACKQTVNAIQEENTQTLQQSLAATKKTVHQGKASNTYCEIGGVYKTNWGDIAIRRIGNSITAQYTHDKGIIKGQLEGKVVTGNWSEAPSYTGPTDAGPMQFTLDDDCSTFAGLWAYDSTSSGWEGAWTGSEKLGSEPYPEVILGPVDAANLKKFAYKESPRENKRQQEKTTKEVLDTFRSAKTSTEKSPLAKVLPLKLVPVAASAISLGLLLYWKTIAKLAGIIAKRKIASAILSKIKKKKKLKTKFTGFHVFGVRIKYRELIAVTTAAVIFSLANAYTYLFKQQVFSFVFITVLINICFHFARNGIRLLMDKIHKTHTEYKMWHWGAMITLFSGWLGSVFSLAGYTIADEKTKDRQSGPASYTINLITFCVGMVFATIYMTHPGKYLQMAVVLACNISFLAMLPISPFGGKKVYEWNKTAWAIAFVPMAMCYMWINFV